MLTVLTALAVVGRGDLPLSPLHGRTLLSHALDALRGLGHPVAVVAEPRQRAAIFAEVARHHADHATVVDEDTWWAEVRGGLAGDASPGLLVHDPLCPLVPTDFLAAVAGLAATAGPEASAVAVRPVTDTVKTVEDGIIGATIDRDGLAALVAPAWVAPAVLARAVAADQRPPLEDPARLTAWLRSRGEVQLRRGPLMARRVEDASAVTLLECVDELARRVRD